LRCRRRAALQPGDTVRLRDLDRAAGSVPHPPDRGWRVRRIEAVSHAGGSGASATESGPIDAGNDASASFVPELVFLDLPVLSGSDETGWARAAGAGNPLAPDRSVEFGGKRRLCGANHAGCAGANRHAAVRLAAGTRSKAGSTQGQCADRGRSGFGGLASASRLSLLNGANAAAVRSDAGAGRWSSSNCAEEIASRAAGGFKPFARTGRNRRRHARRRKLAGADFVFSTARSCRLGFPSRKPGAPQLDCRGKRRIGGSAAVTEVFAGGERALTRCRRCICGP
jgi:hypothetical protein